MAIDRVAQHCICCASTHLDRSPAVLMPFVASRVFGHEPVSITPEWGLRDLQPGMAYTLCTSLQCQACGVLFLDYRFSDREMMQLYHGYRDEAYTLERERFEPGYAAANQHYQGRADYVRDVEAWLEPRVTSNPRVLDWGGDSGINSPFLGRSSRTHIFDISSVETVDGAQAVDRAAIKTNSYDLVVCSQVLEHVSDPHELLVQIAECLDDDTLLYLEVPREALMREHPDRKDLAGLKRHWHEHINFYTEESLRALVLRAGLLVQECMTLDIDLGWRKSSIFGLTARRARS
ncbi:class I SAM-dependent methyltransferase [Pseudomonas sp. FW305-20]|nr:class I SAM-dependent methyltransferase [Pseudomonas sp. FW305-20]PMU16633.1 class I SAM-dependent methyltransferase [Pseudomonas sp. FW305-122]PMU40419.1 class I SAM-dependent methyltransferase [Pseudomonas sp. FW305-47B]PMX60639.1 class I SAM-dependent methyltransferase [Pseudomonas sp. FW305-33]PMX66980.1 class I SAM-dependent methyltransferase [Pseudomonas sp. FW305-60]